jgi:hypothetical protein
MSNDHGIPGGEKKAPKISFSGDSDRAGFVVVYIVPNRRGGYPDNEPGSGGTRGLKTITL